MNPGFWSHRQMIAHPLQAEDRIRLTAIGVLLLFFLFFKINFRAGIRRRNGTGREAGDTFFPDRKQSGDMG